MRNNLMKKLIMNDNLETCSFEEKDKERINIAVKMFKDGVTYKIIKRYTGIDVPLYLRCFENAMICY
jgi:DNA invertase Pin-like site-specific DNA recombinase